MHSTRIVLSTIFFFYLCDLKLVENCRKTMEVVFPSSPAKAIALMKGSLNGSVISGVVTFQQNSILEPLQITVNISGLEKGSPHKHGFHVHQFAIRDPSDNPTIACGSAGFHFNPLNATHGASSAATRHVGDYGNVISDENGNIITTFQDTMSQLFGPFGVLGRTLVLHEKEDDLGLKGDQGSLSGGNAGNRVACGIIGITN